MIAKDGRAILNGELVPRAEVAVLEILSTFDTPVTVPQVQKVLKSMSDATIYSLMKRLKKRQLVVRTEGWYVVYGTSIRRVLWEPIPVVREFFKTQRPKTGHVERQPL